MYFSKLLGKTLREVPAEADSISHQLLVRAGFIQQLATGVYSYLPLGWRTLTRIARIVREEMDRVGGQELQLPALQPLELWQQSGRFDAFGKILFTLKDRKEHDLVLGPTHEEVITDTVRRSVQSYRDLPVLPYQIQVKFRDEPRPRGGLLRVREFIMKDLYSFDADEAGLDVSYDKMVNAYQNIYRRCGIEAMMVEADSGAIGGKTSHEFMIIAETGEDEIICCEKCGSASNIEKAKSAKTKAKTDPQKSVEEIATPGMKSIEEVAAFVGVPPGQTIKAVFYIADGEFIFVVIRGDLPVNEVKLKNLLKAADLRLATEAEVSAAGIVAGFASPVGVKSIKVVADDSIMLGTNFIAGANKPHTHLKNVNYPRDFKVDLMADIALARAGDACVKCGASLKSLRGIEAGHIFKLGIFLSEKFGAYFLDRDGASRPMVMGCYGIGIGRLLAAVVEQQHDDKGIIWPVSIAPYHVHLCTLYPDKNKVAETAEPFYQELWDRNIEVLYDDRDAAPGVKFNDADLIGLPLRLTISPRTLEKQGVELKWRSEKQSRLVPLNGVVEEVVKALQSRR
ncbi:MAG: proline--tRNA ligase [Chloroflexota bacterium]